MNLQKGGSRMKTMKGVFVFLMIVGVSFLTSQSTLQGAGGGAVPWDAIQVNRIPRHWVEHKGGELTVLFERVYASSSSMINCCPFGVFVKKMTFALRLKVAGNQVVYSQVRDVVICDDDFNAQWIELQNFLNEVVIYGICGSQGIWGPPAEGGNWVITRLAKPAADPDVFMAEINIAVKCSP
jgi:hypothetical protein